jgi:hypothetical protein
VDVDRAGTKRFSTRFLHESDAFERFGIEREEHKGIADNHPVETLQPCPSTRALLLSRGESERLVCCDHSKKGDMARKTVVVSDKSGEQIQDGKGAKVRITFDEARSGSVEMDVKAEEARAMGAKGRQVARRGRRPKSS